MYLAVLINLSNLRMLLQIYKDQSLNYPYNAYNNWFLHHMNVLYDGAGYELNLIITYIQPTAYHLVHGGSILTLTGLTL